MGISTSTKVVVQRKSPTIVENLKKDFWSLAGALKSEVKLSNEELAGARKSFSKDWGRI